MYKQIWKLFYKTGWSVCLSATATAN